MSEIPQPEMLDPDRILTDEREEMTLEEHRDRARELAAALRDSCAYARQLWDQLDANRRYLVDSLAQPALTADGLGGTAPTGPDDDRGWQAWTENYAAVTSVLAGSHGDSGFGMDEARQVVRARLEFAGGQRPTQETIEGVAAKGAPPPTPAVPVAFGQAVAFVAGAALGWLRGRRHAVHRSSSL